VCDATQLYPDRLVLSILTCMKSSLLALLGMKLTKACWHETTDAMCVVVNNASMFLCLVLKTLCMVLATASRFFSPAEKHRCAPFLLLCYLHQGSGF